jgi:hypothetical protein
VKGSNSSSTHNSDDAQEPVGGVCHTFMLIEAGIETYLLERLQEGIRFQILTEDDDEEVQKRNAFRMYVSTNQLSSRDIIRWIERQRQCEYQLLFNNCIHFCYQFGRDFNFRHILFTRSLEQFFINAQVRLFGNNR